MKTTTTEQFEVCSMCAGRGQEITGAVHTAGPELIQCRYCHGSGQKLLLRTVTTEVPNPDVQQFLKDVAGQIEDNVRGIGARVRDALKN
jgi:DnaJ-class molecular chaperone